MPPSPPLKLALGSKLTSRPWSPQLTLPFKALTGSFWGFCFFSQNLGLCYYTAQAVFHCEATVVVLHVLWKNWRYNCCYNHPRICVLCEWVHSMRRSEVQVSWLLDFCRSAAILWFVVTSESCPNRSLKEDRSPLIGSCQTANQKCEIYYVILPSIG